MRYVPYLVLGFVFGVVIIKSEAASWYRIQEMFYFQSFHMYGILLSAILTASEVDDVDNKFAPRDDFPTLPPALILGPRIKPK